MQRVVKTRLFFLALFVTTLNIQAHDLANLFSLAFELRKQNNLEKSAAVYQKIIEYAPSNITAYHCAALSLRELEQYEKAIPLYKTVLKYHPDNANAHVGLAQAYLAQGDFKRGWPEFRWRTSVANVFPEYQWNNVDLSGKRILIRTEWGLGDNIQFIRYAQLLKKQGATVFVQAYKELVPLFSICPYIDHVVLVDNPLPDHDMQIPIISLAQAFNTTVETIPATTPYLHAHPGLIQKWKKKLPQNKFNIGICWSGKGDIDAPASLQKNIPLNHFAPIAQLENVQLYSLQKVGNAQEGSTHFALHLFDDDFDETNGRFMDTAAAIRNFDLVITIDTSIAHLAGALGTPVWLLLPRYTDWRWMLKQNESPWYSTMRLFKQHEGGNWDEVMERVMQELEPLVALKTKIIELNDGYFSTLLDYANELNQAHNYFQAKHWYEILLRTLPEVSPVIYNYALLLRKAGKIQTALEYYKKAIEKQPNNWQYNYGYAQALLTTGNLKKGFEHLQWRISNDGTVTPQQITPENVKSKRVLLRAEWGIGDVIHLIRYTKLLKERGAIVSVHMYKELLSLLAHCPYIDHIIPDHEPLPEHDLYIPMFSLPYLFETTLDTIPCSIPYLYPDPKLRTHWHEQLKHDRNFKIGICCEKKNNDIIRPPLSRRAIQLSAFEHLTQLPGVSVYCLQKKDEIDMQRVPKAIHFFDDDFDTKNGNFCDTAAIMTQLDLVISIDTSIAHLAGALGTPIWMPLPVVSDWRWMLQRTDSPWYPTMLLFRQKTQHNWSDIINTMIQTIKPLVAKHQKGNA